MENEENRGLFYKKAFEDHLVLFVNAFLDLSHYSLSFSLTLVHLEFLGAFWHWNNKVKKAGRRRKQGRRSKNQVATTGFFAGIEFHA